MAKPVQELKNRAQNIWPGAFVVERKRNLIKHAHPTDPSRYMLDGSIGPIHYGDNEDQEIDTTWQPTTGTWQHEMLDADYHARAKDSFNGAPLVEYEDRVTGETISFQSRQLEFTNDNNDIQFISSPQAINASVNEDVLSWIGAFGTGLDFEWEAEVARLVKRLIIRSLEDLPTPSAQILSGNNPVLRLSWQMAYSTDAPWIDGVQWNESSDIESFNAIEFRNLAGDTIFAFGTSTAFDGNGDPTKIITHLSKSGPNLLVEVRVPWTYLQSAIFPVTVDPNVDVQLADGNNDARDAPGIIFDYTGTIINLGTTTWWNGHRFPNITITQGATIDVAYCDFYFYSTSTDDPNTVFRCEDVDNPDDFATTQDISNRTQTTATVTWNATGVVTTGAGFYSSPSLVDIVQEIIDRGTWTSGNAIAVLGDNSNPRGDGGDGRVRTYEDDTTHAAKIHIEYTGSNIAPTVSLNIPDLTQFNTNKPTLLMTGTDPESDNIRYNIQISDRNTFDSGITLGAHYDTGTDDGTIHPNPLITGDTPYGDIQVDDRPGTSFTATGGILDHIDIYLGLQNDPVVDGTAYVRIYEHAGVYGTSSQPKFATSGANTPSPEWLAISDANVWTYTVGSPTWHSFNFTGNNRIKLDANTYYILVVDWVPNDRNYENAIAVRVSTDLGYSGNLWVDGQSVNYGVYSVADLLFRVYVNAETIDKISGTDSGFENIDTPANNDPFTSGDQIGFTVQQSDALSPGLHYWRARGIDPNGGGVYGSWASTRSFLIASSLLPSERGVARGVLRGVGRGVL